jgi:molybdenum storage protein
MSPEPTSQPPDAPADRRHHVRSFLMRESLLDKQVMSSTETPVVRMLPDCHVLKVGGRSILDGGKATTYPLVQAIARALEKQKLVIGVGGGVRSRHVFAIGSDLGLPPGVLAQLALLDSNGNAHMLGTLLAPHGVVAIPPEIFGHLLPFFMRAVPGVIFSGDPPYSLWEHPPHLGRIPPHRSDAGCYLLAECFGCASVTLLKDVDGLYERDPKTHPGAGFIRDITAAELKERNLPTLPFDRVLLDLLACGRLVKTVQVVNGRKPELLEPALRGEPVGTVIRKDASTR